MKHNDSVTRTLNAVAAARQAVETARFAQDLLRQDPTAWDFADAAYWLCRAAQAACEQAADALSPEVAAYFDFHRRALAAAEEAAGYADQLVTLAEEANHIIRR